MRAILPMFLSVLIAMPALADEESDVQAVKRFLANQYPGKQWRQGPTRLRNDAIDQAYGDSRFYYVFSPSYPVARADLISVMMRLDKDGAVTALSGEPGAYDAGLMPVKEDADAKAASSAVMSLTFGPWGPVSVSVDDVKLARDKRGWTATAVLKSDVFKVKFDAAGHCTAAEHQFKGPLPICIGGLFLPENFDGSPALRTVSVDENSTAARAGLRAGDVIVSFDGHPLPEGDVIQEMRQRVYPLKQNGNTERPIEIVRDGQLIRLMLRW